MEAVQKLQDRYGSHSSLFKEDQTPRGGAWRHLSHSRKKGHFAHRGGLEAIRYHRIKRALDQEFIQSIQSFNSGAKVGEVKVATYSSIVRSAVLPCFKQVLRGSPHVHVDMMSRELDELPFLLLSGQVDFIVTTAPIKRQTITVDPVADEEFVHIRPTGITTACDLPYLDHDASDRTTYQFLEKQGLPCQISRNFYDDIYMILDAVEYGFGQAIVSKHLLADRNDVAIVKHKEKMVHKIFLQYYRNAYQPKFQLEIAAWIKGGISKFLLAT